jgi:hypothetical protein
MKTAPVRLRTVFLVLLAVTATAICIWQIYWVQPEKDCIGKRHFWAAPWRACATPVFVKRVHGHPPPIAPSPVRP